MSFQNPFSELAFGRLLESALPDFVLAFTFFTALAYAVLGKRLGHQRSAVAASAAMGLALAAGLTWWEQKAGLSVKNLGPVAIGFAVIVLGGVMYQAIRQTGGSWAGAGIALGASLLVGWTLGIRWPVAEQIVQTVITVALIAGILAFLVHHGAQGGASPASHVLIRREVPVVKQDIRDVHEDHNASDFLGRRLRDIKRTADGLHEHPADAENVLLQLGRMLPAEGWLMERMANLRAQAYRAREGHVARIEEIRHLIDKLSAEDKKRAADELKARYRELNLDSRIDRLDRAAVANEKRIRELTRQAQAFLAAHDYRRLHGVLETAKNLQRHNSRLFQIIDRTEQKLSDAARKIAKNTRGVTDA